AHPCTHFLMLRNFVSVIRHPCAKETHSRRSLSLNFYSALSVAYTFKEKELGCMLIIQKQLL
ncbi:hypothetical protein, partial [Pseudoalteromonas luteoviolacea]|uniref:hypothetical protein n=1 Tax=Pseudoalteromonas luteoviolacea TaxID=43657 RepID=UPI001E2FCE08